MARSGDPAAEHKEKGTVLKTMSLTRRVFATLCAALLCLSASAAFAPAANAADGTREFTDSLGRVVEVPEEITAICPSGHTANQVLLTMAPELMVGLSQQLSDDQIAYIDPDGELGLADMPVFGAAFGAKGDLNKEAVAAAGAQVLIDTGEPKDGLAEDLDTLQEQLGIPCVFINTPLDDWGSAYRLLGELLGMEERGEELASYCDAAYEEVTEIMANIPEEERVNVAYLLGDAGLNAIAQGSYQGTVIDMIANNVVVVEKASGSGAGNEISLEQIAVWNPEMIVFGANSIYDTVADEAAWQGIDAIANDNYYEVPSSPWTWLNNPPTVNQVLGMQWFVRLCYPDQFDNDMQDVVTSYYKTFYGYELTDEEYGELVADALPKA